MLKGTNAEISAGTGGTLAGPIAKQFIDYAFAAPDAARPHEPSALEMSQKGDRCASAAAPVRSEPVSRPRDAL